MQFPTNFRIILEMSFFAFWVSFSFITNSINSFNTNVKINKSNITDQRIFRQHCPFYFKRNRFFQTNYYNRYLFINLKKKSSTLSL